MKKTLAAIMMSVLLTPAFAKDIDMKKYGAKADGKTKVTKVLQKAIDEVSESGGGKVTLSGGIFLTGPV